MTRAGARWRPLRQDWVGSSAAAGGLAEQTIDEAKAEDRAQDRKPSERSKAIAPHRAGIHNQDAEASDNDADQCSHNAIYSANVLRHKETSLFIEILNGGDDDAGPAIGPRGERGGARRRVKITSERVSEFLHSKSAENPIDV